jgi:hypothetical protein
VSTVPGKKHKALPPKNKTEKVWGCRSSGRAPAPVLYPSTPVVPWYHQKELNNKKFKKFKYKIKEYH